MSSSLQTAAGAEQAGLRVQGVYAQYGHVPVLRDISLTVARGECVALMGPNGVGKTTTIRTICGLLRPTDGGIYWDHNRLDSQATHEVVNLGVACVPEGRRLYQGMTIEENLLMGAYSVKKDLAAARLEKLYTTFPLLRERRKQLAGTLSGGQQQLCAVGRALMSNPSLLLIDELSLGLSPKATHEVVEALQLVIENLHLTILIVEQDITVAAALASRGYFLDLGSVVGSGPMTDLMSVDYVRQLYFSGSPR